MSTLTHSRYSVLFGFGLLMWSIFLSDAATAATRLKELARIEGTRSNDIVGYGIVVGLAGTGDRCAVKPLCSQSLTHLTNLEFEFPLMMSTAGMWRL